MECVPDDWGDGYANVIVGCTVENQAMADYRLPIFRSLPIKHKSIIVSPILTAVDLTPYLNETIEEVSVGGKEFDCSSFTRYVYKHFGYELTAYSAVQFREGRPVESYFQLQKGDIVFFGKKAGVRNIGHVGIVVSVDKEKGSFTFIHASVSHGVVEQTSSHPYFMMRYMGARRILPDE